MCVFFNPKQVTIGSSIDKNKYCNLFDLLVGKRSFYIWI